MTERLYYTDAYLTEFEAVVVARADEGRRVYLDRTAFYPTSGGQPHDTGRLGTAAVVDVIDEDGRIAHVLAEPLTVDRVRGEIDWTRRLDHMRQHTGQHVLSAVLHDAFGYATVSVHFGREASTLDLTAGELRHEQVVEAERVANREVMANRAVAVTFEDAATAAGLRKPSDRTGSLRIITIAGLDRSACGGTHVRATGEIGPIVIRKVERVKQLVRVEFLCGDRAMRRARADADLLGSLAVAQSASPDELPALLEAQRAELKAGTSARKQLEDALARYRAGELYAAQAPDARGRRVAVVREGDGPVERLRTLAQAYGALSGGVFVGVVERPAAIILAASADANLDAGKRLKDALGAHGGRGGGNPRLAQGTVTDPAKLDAAVAAILAD